MVQSVITGPHPCAEVEHHGREGMGEQRCSSHGQEGVREGGKKGGGTLTKVP